ncbi:hypothetical protein [Escherichia coli]|uniref:hypothetical protein n=1 Tax=Escherichia coli TaxID=562 RepID=UPI00183584DD|nr:hypothetical protein [Escherichia coli]
MKIMLLAGKFKQDKIERFLCITVIPVLMIFSGVTSSPLALAEDITSLAVSVPVTMVKIQATCDVTFSGGELGTNGGLYWFGTLSPGETKEHTPFNAVINCQDADGTETVNTALIAAPKGNSITNNNINMFVDGQESENAPKLWLKHDGKEVPLDGSTPFCVGLGLKQNTCPLTPCTQVPTASPTGKVSATIVFNVTYT